jgi:hypothetical protein
MHCMWCRAIVRMGVSRASRLDGHFTGDSGSSFLRIADDPLRASPYTSAKIASVSYLL